MSARDFAERMEATAATIGEARLADVQVLLRRGALRLRNAGTVPFDDDVDKALSVLAAEMRTSPQGAVRAVVRQWLDENGYLARGKVTF